VVKSGWSVLAGVWCVQKGELITKLKCPSINQFGVKFRATRAAVFGVMPRARGIYFLLRVRKLKMLMRPFGNLILSSVTHRADR